MLAEFHHSTPENKHATELNYMKNVLRCTVPLNKTRIRSVRKFKVNTRTFSVKF